LKLRAGFDHRKRILEKREHHRGSPTLAREGLSLNAMAKRLNDLDVKTSRGFAWTATVVRRAMLRLKA
jgi:hypothetical protein